MDSNFSTEQSTLSRLTKIEEALDQQAIEDSNNFDKRFLLLERMFIALYPRMNKQEQLDGRKALDLLNVEKNKRKKGSKDTNFRSSSVTFELELKKFINRKGTKLNKTIR